MSKSKPSSDKLQRQQSKRELYASNKWGHKVYARFHRDEVRTRDLQLIERISAFDPTPNKVFLPWLCQRYIEGEFSLLHDPVEPIHMLLRWFSHARDSLPSPDITHYRSLKHLNRLREKIGEVHSRRQAEAMVRDYLYREGKVRSVVQHPEGKIIELRDFEAVQYYSRGSRWCITNKETYQDYACSDRLYLILWRRQKFLVSINRHDPLEAGMADVKDQYILSQKCIDRTYPAPWPVFLLEILMLLHLVRHGQIKRWWSEQLPLSDESGWVSGYWGEYILRRDSAAVLMKQISSHRTPGIPRVRHTLCRHELTESMLMRFPELETYLK